MNYRTIIYALMFLLTIFSFSGINFNNFFKVNHILESRILIIILALAISYMASEFVINFVNL